MAHFLALYNLLHLKFCMLWCTVKFLHWQIILKICFKISLNWWIRKYLMYKDLFLWHFVHKSVNMAFSFIFLLPVLNFFIYRTQWTVEDLFLAPSVCCFLFVYEMSQEPLNGFAPDSHGRRVLFLALTTLKVKVTRDKKRHFSALSAACVRFMFGKNIFSL